MGVNLQCKKLWLSIAFSVCVSGHVLAKARYERSDLRNIVEQHFLQYIQHVTIDAGKLRNILKREGLLVLFNSRNISLCQLESDTHGLESVLEGGNKMRLLGFLSKEMGHLLL